MRSNLLMTFVLLAFAAFALLFWWRRPIAHVQAPNGETEQATQSSQMPLPKVTVEPARALTIVKKFTHDPRDKGAPFLPKVNLDGPQRNDLSPMELYRGMKMSDAVQVNGRPQKVLGARAVPNANYNSSFGPVLFQKHGFSIVGLDTEADPAWEQMPMHNGDRPVVVNPSNGRLGIVTGTLMIKFADIHQADKLAGRENLELLSLDESINVGFFRAPENYPLLGALDRLRNERDVLRVELEVVEAFKGVR